MEPVIVEKNRRLFLVGDAKVVQCVDDLACFTDVASDVEWDIAQGSPFVKWVSGNYTRSGEPNKNTQFFTAGDLEFGDYSIRYAPLNLVHRVRQPIGFFHSARRSFSDEAADTGNDFTVQVLAGMWTHIFPLEAALIDQADDSGSLCFSMECRGEKITCAGDAGCGNTFDYMAFEDHCEHLKGRTSIRHLVNPTFRGGAIIIPPVKPGWTEAHAKVYQKEVVQEAAKFAEATEDIYGLASADGSLSASDWEGLMAGLIREYFVEA